MLREVDAAKKRGAKSTNKILPQNDNYIVFTRNARGAFS